MLVRQLLESNDSAKDIFLGGGWLLRPETDANGFTSYILHRLMDDTEYGEAAIMPGVNRDEVIFKFNGYVPPFDGFLPSTRFRAPSKKMEFDAFIDWMKTKVKDRKVDEDLFSDARKARLAKARDANPVWLIRLNKNGEESRMNDARTSFKDEKAAKDYHDRMVQLNPNSQIAHMMYSTDGEQVLRVKLVGGKLEKAPGGARANVVESQGHSTEVQVLQNALKKGPIFHAGRHDGDLVFHEIYSIQSRGDRYVKGAGKELAGRPYAVLEFKAPGYNSVNGKKGVGDGWGNGSFTIPDDDGEKEVYVRKVKIWSDQPEFLVVWTFRGLESDINEHDARMRKAK